uniref:Tail tubular protein n=1 Tax=viral metagenome TaxID=1070528 RepID=A0A6H1ZCZ2_9ZZZZ
MTGTEIITMFRNLIDDSLDSDFELQLLNGARRKVEGERDWEFLKKEDSSKSATNSAIDLPSDYMRTLALYVNNEKYMQIPFEQKRLFVNSSMRWYLDMANSQYYILGANLSGMVNHFYIYDPDEVTASTEPVWPCAHELIAYEMAEQYFAIDQGDKNYTWDDRMVMQKSLYHNQLVNWQTQITRRSVENAVPDDYGAEYDLGSM